MIDIFQGSFQSGQQNAAVRLLNSQNTFQDVAKIHEMKPCFKTQTDWFPVELKKQLLFQKQWNSNPFRARKVVFCAIQTYEMYTSCLLMPWILTSPRHQGKRYWSYKQSPSCLPRGWISTVCTVLSTTYIKRNNILLFLKTNQQPGLCICVIVHFYWGYGRYITLTVLLWYWVPLQDTNSRIKSEMADRAIHKAVSIVLNAAFMPRQIIPI